MTENETPKDTVALDESFFRARVLTKRIASVFVGYCAASLVKTALESVTPEPQNKSERAKKEIGSYAIGAVVSAATASVVNEEVDAVYDVIELFKKNKTEPESEQEPLEGIVITD